MASESGVYPIIATVYDDCGAAVVRPALDQPHAQRPRLVGGHGEPVRPDEPAQHRVDARIGSGLVDQSAAVVGHEPLERPVRQLGHHLDAVDRLDLPIDRDCIGDAADGRAPGCGPTQTDRHGLLSHFPLSEPASRADDGAIPADCLLRDGLFYGHLYIGPDGMRCASRNSQPSLRLIAVDYADINGDGYLDAVLRFVPIGPGAARSPLILPLTRTSPGGPFKTPETLSIAP